MLADYFFLEGSGTLPIEKLYFPPPLLGLVLNATFLDAVRDSTLITLTLTRVEASTAFSMGSVLDPSFHE